jgi:hypothetical protein
VLRDELRRLRDELVPQQMVHEKPLVLVLLYQRMKVQESQLELRRLGVMQRALMMFSYPNSHMALRYRTSLFG